MQNAGYCTQVVKKKPKNQKKQTKQKQTQKTTKQKTPNLSWLHPN